MKKKLITLILSGIALITSLAGCGAKENNTASDNNADTVVTDNVEVGNNAEAEKEAETENKVENEDEEDEDNEIRYVKDSVFKDEQELHDFSNDEMSLKYDPRWDKVESEEYKLFLKDKKETTVTLDVKDMNGVSEEEFNEVCEAECIEKYGVDKGSVIALDSSYNDNKVRASYYIVNPEADTLIVHQITFFNDEKAYLFVITLQGEMDHEAFEEFNKILNTVAFN